MELNAEKIRETLAKLQNNKASGPDNIVVKVLKNLPIHSKLPLKVVRANYKKRVFHYIGKRAKYS